MTLPGQRYSTVAIVLHWAIALAILLNLYLGLRMGVETGLAKFQVFQLHKSVGFTVLALSLCRLAWRLTHRPPPYPETMKPWEKAAATTVHTLFYVIMIGMPLTGWVIVSASPTNIPTLLYKTVPVPHLGFIHDLAMATRKSVEAGVGEVHEFMAFATMALIVLHVGAALKHQFWNKDGVLFRMAPFLRFGARP
jgi:cytochrome b561